MHNKSNDEEIKKKVMVQLHEVSGIKFGEFTLTSGKTSPYYVDLRIIPSHPGLFDTTTSICADLIKKNIRGDYKIAGVPTSGLPFATMVSQKLKLPLLYVRKQEKSHGRKKGVEGKFDGGEVLLIDDVSTTGGSIKNASETVRQEGGTVEHAVVILDREEGARKNLKNIDVSLHACFNISELIKYLKESSKISEEEYSTMLNYLNKK